jgi:hypothetical protein
MMKNFLLLLLALTLSIKAYSQQNTRPSPVRGFHLDLRIQVMTMSALTEFVQKLQKQGINTLIMEWEATYPFDKHPMISNRYAYSRSEVTSFITYCNSLGIDVIPLQQSFGHVEYILRNPRYTALREDQKDYSQVCPIESALNRTLFTELFTDLVSTHNSPYFHIGGDETYLLGHCHKCQAKVAEEGKSKLFVDHIKITILIDWNYGWAINRFGDPKKLVETGFEIWGAPSLRSHPDNYFLTQWEKHIKNIRDFVPTSRQMGYKGLIMKSWSTSGQYSPVFESSSDIVDLYAIRHVYPITGFNLLLSAYGQSLKTTQPLNVEQFVETYTRDTYGFTKKQASRFWQALTTAPYEVAQGEVVSPKPMTIQTLLDSTRLAAKILADLTPARNKQEFEQYRLMTDIRVEYLTYQEIEKEVNAPSFTTTQIPPMLTRLKTLMADSEKTSKRFTAVNKAYFHPAELEQETYWRTIKPRMLYERLAKTKSRTSAGFPQSIGK